MNKSEKDQIKFESVEDVVKYVEENHSRTETRWQLSSRTSHPYIDEEAGRKWHDEYYGMHYVGIGEPGRKNYELAKKRLEKAEPAQTVVTEYYLVESSTWRNNYLFLSKELYDLFDSIWTKGPVYRGSNDLANKGRLSLPGILKRLGRTDVSERINQAKQAAKLADEKRSRNYDRKQIREAATKLYGLLTKSSVIEWDTSENGPDVHFFARLSILTKIIDEV